MTTCTSPTMSRKTCVCAMPSQIDRPGGHRHDSQGRGRPTLAGQRAPEAAPLDLAQLRAPRQAIGRQPPQQAEPDAEDLARPAPPFLAVPGHAAQRQQRVADHDRSQLPTTPDAAHQLQPDEEDQQHDRRPGVRMAMPRCPSREVKPASPEADRQDVVQGAERIEPRPDRSQQRADQRQAHPAEDPQHQRSDLRVAIPTGDGLQHHPSPRHQAQQAQRPAQRAPHDPDPTWCRFRQRPVVADGREDERQRHDGSGTKQVGGEGQWCVDIAVQRVRADGRDPWRAQQQPHGRQGDGAERRVPPHRCHRA